MDTLITPRRRAVLGAFGALGAASLLAAWGGRPDARRAPIEFGGATMGSLYRVQLADAKVPRGLEMAARGAVDAALRSVDEAMSTFRLDSELSRFNDSRAGGRFELSPDMLAIFSVAREVNAATRGAFDVTVGPLVDAWGFGRGRHERVVADAERRRLERAVGMDLLELDTARGTLSKSRPDVRADLSGIAKGYGVDQAARALDALGLEHYLIDAGGEVRTRGRNADGLPWQVAIEQPFAGVRRPRLVVPLSDAAIATSGDYRICFEQAGRRYSHEIDPATGKPIDGRLASVSVVARTGALADALGKLIVLGPDAGYERAAALGLAAHFIVREPGGTLRDRMTPAFAALGGRTVDGVS